VRGYHLLAFDSSSILVRLRVPGPGGASGSTSTSAPSTGAAAPGDNPHTSSSVRRLGCGYAASLPSLSTAVLNINATLAVPSLDFMAANGLGLGSAPAAWTARHSAIAHGVPETLLDTPTPGKARAVSACSVASTHSGSLWGNCAVMRA
jgi:hypothetical protein